MPTMILRGQRKGINLMRRPCLIHRMPSLCSPWMLMNSSHKESSLKTKKIKTRKKGKEERGKKNDRLEWLNRRPRRRLTWGQKNWSKFSNSKRKITKQNTVWKRRCWDEILLALLRDLLLKLKTREISSYRPMDHWSWTLSKMSPLFLVFATSKEMINSLRCFMRDQKYHNQ